LVRGQQIDEPTELSTGKLPSAVLNLGLLIHQRPHGGSIHSLCIKQISHGGADLGEIASDQCRFIDKRLAEFGQPRNLTVVEVKFLRDLVNLRHGTRRHAMPQRADDEEHIEDERQQQKYR